jgi:sec-independent protein translocase protein TatB
MFDIGFWELLVIGVVALLVIGPERLPKVARTAGLWLGRARRFVSSVKADIDREIAAEELKKVLAKQADSSGVHEILEETRKSIDFDEAPAPKPQQSSAPESTASRKAGETSGTTRSDKPNDAGG